MTFVWVPGASGMLGRAVCAELRARQILFVGTNSGLPIADADAVAAFVESSPEITHVINCAAYTRVDACETPEGKALAERVNVAGPGTIAQMLPKAVTVHVSTDYVFSGRGSMPYREIDDVDPVNTYGRSKLLGEQTFLKAGGTYVMRTSWLFGAHGSNFVTTMRKLLSERSEVRVVDNQHGRPTYTNDLAEALIDLALLQPERGVYHFANAEPTTWFDFARAIASTMRTTAQVIPIPTIAYPTPARRPAYSVLSTTKIEQALGRAPRPWRQALADYIMEIT